MSDRLKVIGNAVVFSLIPLVACVIYAAFQGVMLWDINNIAANLPDYNDGIFYVKQIDAMVHYGMPKGYFGYNESAAQIGTLGAWPVFLFYPYVLMGKIFGFSATHMMVFNIVFVMAAFAVFYLLAKPDAKQGAALFVLLLAVPFIPRYMLSCMTEALFHAGVVIFAGFIICFLNGKYSRISVYVCYLLVIFFALCRPYMLIFIIFPFFAQFKFNKIEPFGAALVSAGVFGLTYIKFVTPRCATYLEQTIDTTVFSALAEGRIFGFVKDVLHKFINDSYELYHLFDTFAEVKIPYFTMAVCMLVFVVLAVIQFRKNRSITDKYLWMAVSAIGVAAAVTAALIIFYVEYTSFRHIVVIVAFAVVMLSAYIKNNKAVVIAAVLAIALCGWLPAEGIDQLYRLPTSENPFGTMPQAEDMAQLNSALGTEISENLWDNTVIYDYNNHNTNYLHAIPTHMGISISDGEFIRANLSEFKSGYILSKANTEYIEMFQNNGWKAEVISEDFILYKRDK